MIEHVFKYTKDGKMLKTTKEVEDDEFRKTWQKDGRQSEDKKEFHITKGEL